MFNLVCKTDPFENGLDAVVQIVSTEKGACVHAGSEAFLKPS